MFILLLFILIEKSLPLELGIQGRKDHFSLNLSAEYRKDFILLIDGVESDIM